MHRRQYVRQCRWRRHCSSYIWVYDSPQWVLTGCLCSVIFLAVAHRTTGAGPITLAFAAGNAGRRHTRAPTKSERRVGREDPMVDFFEQTTKQIWQWLPKPETAPGPTQQFVEEERRQKYLLLRYSNATDEDSKQKKRKAEQKLRQLDTYFLRENADLDRYPVPDFLSNEYGKGNINMAVTGASGVGKSSFINAIRRVRAKDAAAAKTGFLETTMTPAKFDFPTEQGFFNRLKEKVSNALYPEADPIQIGDLLLLNGKQVTVTKKSTIREKITVRETTTGYSMEVDRKEVTGKLSDCVIWDLPGTGTPTFPQATYLRCMGIRHFDLVVLLTATRFTEAEMLLMQELKRWRVPFFLVRTKVDNDVQAEIELEEEWQEEECDIEECQKIKDETISVIKDYFIRLYDKEVYCISSKPRYRDKYDFLTLEQDMEDQIKSQRLILQSEQTDDYTSWFGWDIFR